MFIVAVLVASVLWFVAASVLFFNPIVDKVYQSEESHPAVKQLPKIPKTIGKILIAVLIQSLTWAYVYEIMAPALSGSYLQKGTVFGLILTLVKMLPRDIDRLLLTTYPPKRMIIEFVIGVICCFVVGIVFGYFL